MRVSEAPILTVATLGHPENECYIVKCEPEVWRFLHDGSVVDLESFRAGWDVVSLPPTHDPAGQAATRDDAHYVGDSS